jgi:hypothetical protein
MLHVDTDASGEINFDEYLEQAILLDQKKVEMLSHDTEYFKKIYDVRKERR